MARSIDLSKQSDLEQQQARLALATGKAPASPLGAVARPKPKQAPMPKSAMPLPPGVGGTPPMPAGRILTTILPSNLTENERATLEMAGWTDDVPIPANAAQLLKQIKDEKEAEEVMLPVDPRTPKVAIPTPVPIGSRSKADQDKLRKVFTEATQDLEAKAALVAQEDAEAGSNVPGVAESAKMARQVQAQQGAGFKVIDDRPKAQHAPKPEETPEPDSTTAVHAAFAENVAASNAPAEPAATESDTGANLTPIICPHCLFKYAEADIEEPPYSDKLAFLRAMCGQRPFTKSYELFGGKAILLFRTLTVKEVSEIYRQAYADKQAGKFENELDYYEKLNQYRFCLQLQGFTWPGADGFHYDLPDALSKDTNEFGTGFWWEKPIDPLSGETPLPSVEKYIMENVIKTESLMRTANMTCSDFNRLTSKLEAVAQNSDFWSPTEERS